MRYLSVCSGIEAATVAWHPLGWTPVAFSEIEKFPCQVLAHHYPHVPNRGDIKQFEDWPNDPIGLLVGGTPCQSFSIAGMRQGLDDPRGQLMLVYLEIVRRYRPRWIVWENVPGVLSANKGRDFGAFVGALGHLGYGWSYRVLDAQWFGVPQRRKRVFLVGCFGNPASAAKVLFESESLRRDITPRPEAREEIARRTREGIASGGERMSAPATFMHQAAGKQTSLGYSVEICNTLSSSTTPAVSYGLPDTVGALTDGAKNGAGLNGQDAYTGRIIPANTLTARMYKGINTEVNEGQTPIVSGLSVRRLTVTECERLQGFPDHYTAVANAKDAPRYKALGNSMAVPVVRWIGERIARAEGQE